MTDKLLELLAEYWWIVIPLLCGMVFNVLILLDMVGA